jgi:hypothetical protein
MKVLKALMLASLAVVLVSAASIAQDSMKPSPDQAKTGSSMKAVSVIGKISDDGKSFVSDKDSKSWTIANPDAVKGHEGHHVVLKAHVDADKGEVQVVSLKMAKADTKTDTMQK